MSRLARPVSPALYYATCALSAAVVFAVSVRQGRGAPPSVDFRQYYGAALVARAGAWDDLYPDPIPGGTRNAGEDAVARPRYRRLSEAAGVEPQNFIQPPPCALLYLPLAWLDYRAAEWVWRLAATLAVWLSAVAAGRIARAVAGAPGPTVAETLTVVLVCLCVWKSVNPLIDGNISPFIGLAISAVVLAVVERRAWPAVAAVGFAGLLKVTPLLLLAVTCLRCDRRRLLVAAGVVAAVIGASVAVTGVGPWRRFVIDIAPTLGRPWLPHEGETVGSTLSLYGVAWLFLQTDPLPPAVETSLRVLSAAGLVLILGLIVWRRRRIRQDARSAVAAASSLIVWPLITGPLFWWHYAYYYFGLTGWLVTECGRPGKVRRVLAAVALLVMWAPSLRRLPPHEGVPALAKTFLPLVVASLILGIAVSVLLERREPEPLA